MRAHTLALKQEGQGTLARTPDAPVYDAGSVVVVTATPAEGWHFDHWTGYGIPSGQESNHGSFRWRGGSIRRRQARK